MLTVATAWAEVPAVAVRILLETVLLVRAVQVEQREVTAAVRPMLLAVAVAGVRQGELQHRALLVAPGVSVLP